MAVRAARNTGLIVTLVVFVFLSLVGIGLAITFYTKVNEAQARAQSKEEQYNALVKGATEIPKVEAAAKDAQHAGVVAHLQLTAAHVTRLLTGGEDVAPKQIEAQMKAAGIEEGGNALAYIATLSTERKQKVDEAADLQKKLEEDKKQVEALTGTQDRIAKAADEQKAKLLSDLGALQKDLDALKTAQQERLDELAKNIDKSNKEENEKLIAAENKAENAKSQIDEMKARISKITGGIKHDTPTAPEPLRDVDGHIAAIAAAKNVVYIDLGRQDHLVLGMTFEVFDSARGVDVDIKDNGDKNIKRGKATVEVVNMSDHSATCRVVRSSFGQPIQRGDLLANLVYDKQRQFKFYVFGDFNLDNLGEAGLADREMVINLIERWGGVVVKPEERQRKLKSLTGGAEAEQNLLPFDTDFLIVGAEPTVPAESPNDDAAAIARAKLAKQQLAQFNRLRNEARELGIPILNQNRFLALIGYFQR